MTKNTPIKIKIAEWIKIIYNGYAVIGSDGQINPREEDVSDDYIYFTVHSNPFKIARAAAEYRKLAR